MTGTRYVVIFVTASSRNEARKITDKLIGEKLVACVNIVPGIRSTYWWKGKIETAPEILLTIKTKKSLTGKVIKAVREIHSYIVPEIIVLPIIGGNPDYLKWIGETVISEQLYDRS
jgi:periplasmic divalent cation tolerance protein